MFTRRDAVRGFAAGGGLLAMPALVRSQESTVRVGALNPVSGSGSPYGTGMQRMIVAAAQAINDAGGIGGRRVEVFAEDSQSNPQAGVLAAKKLIEVNRVRAILGTWSSGVSLAVMPLTNAAGIPLFHTSGAPALSAAPANARGLGFRFEATNHRFGAAVAEVCHRQGFTRAAGMAFNNASGISNVEGFRAAWKTRGRDMVGSVVYEPNQTSYRSELSSVLAKGPDVIVAGSYLADTTILMREWFQSGQAVKWVLPGWAVSQDLIKGVGAQVMEGTLVVSSVSNVGSPAYQLFKSAYETDFKGQAISSGFPAICWDAMTVYGLAAEAAGSTEGPAVAAQIRNVANTPGVPAHSFAEGKKALASGKINYEGASSILEFDEFGDAKPDFGVSVITAGTLKPLYTVSI